MGKTFHHRSPSVNRKCEINDPHLRHGCWSASSDCRRPNLFLESTHQPSFWPIPMTSQIHEAWLWLEDLLATYRTSTGPQSPNDGLESHNPLANKRSEESSGRLLASFELELRTRKAQRLEVFHFESLSKSHSASPSCGHLHNLWNVLSICPRKLTETVRADPAQRLQTSSVGPSTNHEMQTMWRQGCLF